MVLCSHQLPSEAVLETKEDVLDRGRSGNTLEQQKTEGWFSTRSEHLGPQRPKAPTTTAVTSALLIGKRQIQSPLAICSQPERDKPDYVVIGPRVANQKDQSGKKKSISADSSSPKRAGGDGNAPEQQSNSVVTVRQDGK